MLRAVVAGSVAAALSLGVGPGARATATVPRGTVPPVRGVDISAYQHAGPPINWRLLAREGVRFVAIKVSEGTYYVNPYYRPDARAAARAGLAVLPYVFANPRRAGAAATADFAIRAAGSARGRLPFVVDLEDDPYKKHDTCYGMGIRTMTAWITGFTRRIEALTGTRPVIYATATWWRECTGATGRFRRDPFWLAAFDGAPPAVPPTWRRWTFWQYDINGTVRGIGRVDLDYYQPTSDLPALRPRAGRPREDRKPKKREPARKPRPERYLRRQPAHRGRSYRSSVGIGEGEGHGLAGLRHRQGSRADGSVR